VATNRAFPAVLAALALVGCLHSEDDDGEQPVRAIEPASAEGRFREQGVTTIVRGWNCGGVYGRWRVRVQVTGAARGEGKGTVVLRPGEVTVFRDEFPVRLAGVPATAEVDLRVRVEGQELDFRGEASAKALFARIRAPIDERLPIRRGPIAECEGT
jgi:hypothetical protein